MQTLADRVIRPLGNEHYYPMADDGPAKENLAARLNALLILFGDDQKSWTFNRDAAWAEEMHDGLERLRAFAPDQATRRAANRAINRLTELCRRVTHGGTLAGSEAAVFTWPYDPDVTMHFNAWAFAAACDMKSWEILGAGGIGSKGYHALMVIVPAYLKTVEAVEVDLKALA